MNIAVTGLNATDNPGPGVPVIRSLRAMPGFNGRIIGLLYDTLEPGAYISGVADRCYLIPYPSSGSEVVYERLAYIHSREKLDLILPTLDTELYVFHKLSSRLRELGIRTFLPSTSQLTMRGKDKLTDFCRDNDLNTPQTRLVNSHSDLRSLPSDFAYPLVIKGIFYDAAVVNNFEEAVASFDRIRRKWGLPIIVQECLTGDEFNVAALGDGNGQTIGAVAMRKLYVTDKGKGWSGVTIHDSALLELTHRVIKRMSWTGGLELEFLKDRRTDEYYLLEINPRFPAWIFLATAAGQNLPAALLALAMNERVTPYQDYEVGKVFVRHSWDLISDMTRVEQLTTAGEL
jgi:carbamoyl-phosphate synthase large subunit